MKHNVQFTLAYEGKDADRHEIDLYDISQALVGFQRSIALTTHLVINNKIITQAPSLKGAKVLALPAEDGSWKITAGVVLTGIYALGTTSNDSPIGHMVYSLYDYVMSESLGVHVDYQKSLGKLYEESESKEITLPRIEQHQADSLLEKCSVAIKEIHRPIYKTKTASKASIISNVQGVHTPLRVQLTQDTYDYIHEVFVQEDPEIIRGRISSYNSNTFKGRIYVAKEGRPISFELSKNARSENSLKLIIASLSAYVHKDFENQWCDIYCIVYKNTSRSGQLKSYTITTVSHNEPNEPR